MGATRYESYGVHLGWSIPTGDGFIMRHDDGRMEWSWAYVNDDLGRPYASPRGYLEEDAQRRFNERAN